MDFCGMRIGILKGLLFSVHAFRRILSKMAVFSFAPGAVNASAFSRFRGIRRIFWKGGGCARAFCSIGAGAAPIRACGFARIGRFLNDAGRKLEKAAFCAAAKRRGIFL